MLRGPGLLLLLAAPSLGAQAEVSAGVGAGSIRYSGGATSTTVTIAPAATVIGRSGAAGLSGAFGPIGTGDWAGQVRADSWAAWPTGGAFRPAITILLDGSVQSGGPATGAAQVVGEAAWTADGHGAALGIGSSLGAISGAAGVGALRLRARAWGRVGDAIATAAVEPQRLDGAWFTDVSLGVASAPGRLSVSAWLAARLSDTPASRGAGGAAVQFTVSRRLAIEAAGGSYLPDVYQGFPASGFVALGARVYLARRAPSPLGARSARVRPAEGVRAGDSVRVRFRVPGATSVAIAGAWTEWTPRPLVRVGRDGWEGWFALAPGLYQFALVVDGDRWTIPPRVARVGDGMGGEAGLLVVP
jgi:hypothetical protein